MLEYILENKDSLDLEEYPVVAQVLNEELDEQDIKNIISILHSLKEEYLYQGTAIHGKYHSEKVFLYCYLLLKKMNYQTEYSKVLFDAALYHDIGRQDNREDEFHGMQSAFRIDQVIGNDELYKDKRFLVVLKALMDSHCRQDGWETNSFENYAYDLNMFEMDLNVPSPIVMSVYNMFLDFSNVLKDADALDRKRFGDECQAALNPGLLRLKPYSIGLIEFAKEINALYYELMKINYKEVYEENMPETDCLHSIGFDFFKIDSVLDNGILSQDAMRDMRVKVPRNFSGGNFDRWISVVDIDLVKDRLTAFQTFIKHGISFKCHGVKLHSPYPNNKRIDALEDGMPWNKSNHGDEKYVLYRIRPEKIIEVRVPMEYLDADIRDMNYLYNSLNIDIIKNRINYYLKKTKTGGNNEIVSRFNALIQQYDNVLRMYLFATPEKRREINLVSMLEPILAEISKEIGKCMTIYYGRLIHFDDYVKVKDVVLYEIENNHRFDAEILYGHDFMHIMLHSPQSRIDKPKEKVIQ